MDIIGGELTCEGDASLTVVSLPQRWIEHSTHSERALHGIDGGAGADGDVDSSLLYSSLASSSGSHPSARSIFDDASFQLIGSFRKQRTEATGPKLLMDPAERQHSAFARQFGLFLRRGLIQQYRPFSVVLVDYALIFIAGAIFGMSQKNTRLLQLPISGALIGLGIGLTTITSSTRTFGNERIVFWRESASGLNRLAYFLAKNLSEVPRLVFIPLYWQMIFQATTAVVSTHNGGTEYVVLLAAVWAVSGMGYLVSLLLKPTTSQLAVVLVVLACLMLNGIFVTSNDMGSFQGLQVFSYAFHLSRALYFLKVNAFIDFYAPDISAVAIGSNICLADQICLKQISFKDSMERDFQFFTESESQCRFQDDMGNPAACGTGSIHWESMQNMWLIGLVARAGAFAALVGTNRHKQV
jgi:hypothetical protein